MNELEHELRKTLCRREPPAGFAERVMHRVPPKRDRMRWLVAVAAILVLVFAGGSLVQQRRTQRRIAAEKAKADLVYAIQVTTSGLQTAKTMLERQAGGKRI